MQPLLLKLSCFNSCYNRGSQPWSCRTLDIIVFSVFIAGEKAGVLQNQDWQPILYELDGKLL